MEASFWIEESDGEVVQRAAGRNELDVMERQALEKVKRAIIRRRAEEFASRSVFEWIMDAK